MPISGRKAFSEFRKGSWFQAEDLKVRRTDFDQIRANESNKVKALFYTNDEDPLIHASLTTPNPGFMGLHHSSLI